MTLTPHPAESPPYPRCGVILVGGKSSRMGQDKATLRRGNRFWWQHLAEILFESGIDEILLVGRESQRQHFPPFPMQDHQGSIHWISESGEHGPLGGLLTAWSLRPNRPLFVIGVDQQCLKASFLRPYLQDPLTASGFVFETSPQKRLEPLAALYPPEAMAWAKSQLHSQQLSLSQLVRTCIGEGSMRKIPLSESESQSLQNWNFPHDVRANP